MKRLLHGWEKRLALICGVAIPACMAAALLLAPLWGWPLTYRILKAATFLFVVTSSLWYIADDDEKLHGSGDHEDWLAGAYVKDPPTSSTGPLTAPEETAVGKETEREAPHGGRERARDKVHVPSQGEAPDEPVRQTYVFKGETGGREGLRERGFPKEATLPRDATLFREYDSWAVYVSNSENALYVRTTDYHPKPLRVTEEMLSELVTAFQREDKQN